MKHSSAHEDQNIHLAKESSNPIIRILWVVLGSFFVVIGGIGVVVPGLPTTLFLILAAACYIRSSQRLYDWLINNKTFGPYLRDYREGKGIPKRAKVLAVSMIIIFVSYAVFFGIESLNLKIAAGILGIAGLLYVLFKVPVSKI
jgi:uncharacterized membrane protein YbaN (DUF454 family)|tara:strand:+ start:3018 stop:3449 length:432 start_codon:yes stop_codon:yes gene_type:complete